LILCSNEKASFKFLPTIESTMNARKRTLLILGLASLVMYYPLTKYLYRYFYLGIDTGFLKKLGFFSGNPGTPLAWILALIFGLGYVMISMNAVPIIKEKWLEISWFNLFGFLAIISAAVVEEAFFRRFIMDRLATNGYDNLSQIILSGLAFGVSHGVWGFLKGSLQVAIKAILYTTLLGLALAIIYLIGDRSLAPCITSHYISAGLIEPWLIYGLILGKPPKS